MDGQLRKTPVIWDTAKEPVLAAHIRRTLADRLAENESGRVTSFEIPA